MGEIPSELEVSLTASAATLEDAPVDVVVNLLKETVDEFNKEHHTSFHPRQVVADYFAHH
jgi:hypothetical protein